MTFAKAFLKARQATKKTNYLNTTSDPLRFWDTPLLDLQQALAYNEMWSKPGFRVADTGTAKAVGRFAKSHSLYGGSGNPCQSQ